MCTRCAGACRFSVVCWQQVRSTSLSRSEGSAPTAFRHDAGHGFLRNTVHVAEVSDTSPNAVGDARVGKPPPPYGAREISINYGTVPTMLPMDADTLRVPAVDSLNPPTSVDKLVGQQHLLTRRVPVLQERHFYLLFPGDQKGFPTPKSRCCLSYGMQAGSTRSPPIAR